MVQPSLKERIGRREVLCGVCVAEACPSVVEAAGYAGFDYVVIDGEHGAVAGEDLLALIRAAEAAGLAPLVRVGAGPGADILRALDAGAQGVVVPHVVDAEGVRAIVGHAHYPPIGRRGLSSVSRAARYGLVDRARHVARAAASTVVVAIVEDREAIPNVASMAREPALDAVMIGASDLAASLGHASDPGHADVAAAVERIRDEVLAVPDGPALMGVVAAGADPAAAVATGCSMLSFLPAAILAAGLRDARARLRR